MEQQETRRKRIAFITSAGVHLVILLLFLFLMAWRAPDPPLPEFGIELNFGDSPVGSGANQPVETTAIQQQTDEQETEQQSQPAEESQQEVIPSPQESPIAVPEEAKPEVQEQPKPAEKKEEAKAAPTTEKTGDQPKSQGNDKDKTGDKGDPQGTPDPNAAYSGKPGGGGGGDGMQLSMTGWEWAETPRIPDLPDNEDGRIVFKIICDEEGEIVGIETVERGLSLRAEMMLVAEIRRNSLNRIGGGQTPERSTGYVVFKLKTK
jgi:protein TonB